MLVPSIFGENLFDDWFDVDFPQWPEFRDLDRAERKLYGRHADRLMKTDVLLICLDSKKKKSNWN